MERPVEFTLLELFIDIAKLPYKVTESRDGVVGENDAYVVEKACLNGKIYVRVDLYDEMCQVAGIDNNTASNVLSFVKLGIMRYPTWRTDRDVEINMEAFCSMTSIAIRELLKSMEVL